MPYPEAVLKDEQLQHAHNAAKEVYETLSVFKNVSPSNTLIRDLSVLVMDATESIETEKALDVSCYDRIFCYATSSSVVPLLKLGFALTVLIEKLLAVKKELIEINKGLTHKATNGHSSHVNGEGPVKEEPIDPDDQLADVKMEEELAEVKKEEEPYVDVYCPLTGEAHSSGAKAKAGASGISNGRIVLQVPILPAKRVETIVVGATVPISQLNIRKRPFKSVAEFAASAKKPPPDNRSKRCHMCGKDIMKFVGTPANHTTRGAFLDRIYIYADEDRTKVEELRSNREPAFFCPKHIADPGNAPYLKPIIKCDICGEPTNNFPARYSPRVDRDPIRAQEFFDSLINVPQKGRERILWFMSNPARATVCLKHINKMKKPEKFDLVKSTAYLTRKRVLEQKAKAYGVAPPKIPAFEEARPPKEELPPSEDVKDDYLHDAHILFPETSNGLHHNDDDGLPFDILEPGSSGLV